MSFKDPNFIPSDLIALLLKVLIGVAIVMITAGMIFTLFDLVAQDSNPGSIRWLIAGLVTLMMSVIAFHIFRKLAND